MAGYNQEQNNDLIQDQVRNFETSGNNLEDLLDLIAIALIQSPLVNTLAVENNQKFIRNGLLQTGQGEGVLALFQKDIKANQEDLNLFDGESGEILRNIADSILNFDSLLISINGGVDNGVSISISGGGLTGLTDITAFLVQDGTFSNVSQFIPLQQSSSIVDIEKAEEFLDTNIFELLPTGDTRQARIIRFFQELNALLPPNPPEFDLSGATDNSPPDGRVDRLPNGTWMGATQYNLDNSISFSQDNPTTSNIEEEDAFIHRLTDTANNTNSTRTIEEIYNRVLPYLTDILEDPIELEDERPEYRNESSGYLQFRNPNQGIVIRNTNQDFIEGLNPDNKTYLNDGFTITMWVRFLDKVSSGTLFNFGNPLRGDGDDTSFGFRLETYVINGDEQPVKSSYGGQTEGEYLGGFGSSGQTWKQIFQDGSFNGNQFVQSGGEVPSEGFFSTSNTERFVRLVVNEGTGVNKIRGSHTGMPFMKRRRGLPEFGMFDYFDEGTPPYNHAYGLMTNTRIPEDFNEWYFICASYDPTIQENDLSDVDYVYNKNYWLNHINPYTTPPSLVNKSNYGNRCKVEIISKTDLLRARGFKV